jgi:predicted PurR-regulated permease PerM
MDNHTEEDTPPSRDRFRNRSGNRSNFWYQLTHGAPVAVMLAAVLYMLYQLLPVLQLIAVAALIAVILRTLLRWLQKLVKVRWIAILILINLILGFGIFLITFIFPSLLIETQQLVVVLPKYLNSLTELSIKLHSNYNFVPDLSQGLAQFQNFADQILGIFPQLLRQILGATIELFATLILALYMAYDPQTLIGGILRLTPRQHHQRFKRLLKATGVRLRGWIFGTGVAMLFLGLGVAIGLWALGIPLALSFGVIAGLLEIIPYFGSIAGALLPVLIALSISPVKFLFTVILFLVLNQVDAHIIQPLVMGKQVNLHPVVVIITFLVMGKLLGLIGVLLAVPAAAVLVTIIDEFFPPESPEEVPVE